MQKAPKTTGTSHHDLIKQVASFRTGRMIIARTKKWEHKSFARVSRLRVGRMSAVSGELHSGGTQKVAPSSSASRLD